MVLTREVLLIDTIRRVGGGEQAEAPAHLIEVCLHSRRFKHQMKLPASVKKYFSYYWKLYSTV